MYNCPMNIDLSSFSRHNSASAQTVHFGRFVPKAKLVENLLLFYAGKPMNTAFFIHRYPSNSFRRDGSQYSFCSRLKLRSLIRLDWPKEEVKKMLILIHDYHCRDQFEAALKRIAKFKVSPNS